MSPPPPSSSPASTPPVSRATPPVRRGNNNNTKDSLELRKGCHTQGQGSLLLSAAESRSEASCMQTTSSSVSIPLNKVATPELALGAASSNATVIYPPQPNHQAFILDPREHHQPPGRYHRAIGPTPSFLLPRKTLILGGSSGNMPGVDENNYHWKVLNLSRAKLKASSRTSALLSGFAMVAMVEIQVDDKIPESLLITFAVCTVLLIAVHMLAVMISTCILPNVEAVANLHYQTQKTVFESPHTKMNFIVELAWGFSTVIGILLFLVEIAILCWMKFYTISHTAAWVATGLLIPILVIFSTFAALFYLKLVSHKSEVYEDGLKELQLLKDQVEEFGINRPHQGSNTSSPASSGRAGGVIQVV